MLYYAIQVRTGDEDRFANRAGRLIAREAGRFLIPKRKLNERRLGKTQHIIRTVFPGYIFLETEALDPDLTWRVRRLPGFYRFLKDTSDPRPLAESDRRLLLRFISFGKAADISKATFDEADRIVVLEGPLVGLEGNIVKVDRRRGRAKVRLDMCETGFLIDFGFESVSKVAKGTEASNVEPRP